VKWDDWTGDKVKSPIRQKFDKFLVGAGAVIFGLGILGGVLGLIYIALNKILPLIVK
jgi:preprotein translocase subunit Sss1